MNLLLEVFSEIMVDLLANHHIHQAVVELFLKDFSNQLASHHVSPLQLRLDGCSCGSFLNQLLFQKI